MSKKAPQKPVNTPQSPANAGGVPTPQSDAEKLAEALRANAGLAQVLGQVANQLDGLRMAILKVMT